MAGAARRFPFLEDAGVVALVCHPDAMTPDGNPLLGPIPGVPGFWLAAGLSLNGFGGAGGLGRTIAEWITTGETELDIHGYRPWRFGAAYRDPAQVEAAGREVYRYYYRLRYPLDTDEWGRPNRLEPAARAAAGRGRGVRRRRTAGSGPTTSSRAGRGGGPAPTSARSAGHRPPYFDRLAEEHAAFRERVGMIDMTLVRQDRGRRARARWRCSTRVCDNRVDRAARERRLHPVSRTVAAGSSPT